MGPVVPSSPQYPRRGSRRSGRSAGRCDSHSLRTAELRARCVVLDLRELKFIDPVSVHAIVDASARARRGKRRLLLVRGPLKVDRVFTLTGAPNALEIGDLDPVAPPAPVPFRELRNDYAA